MNSIRIATVLQVPYLDGAFCASREQYAAVELVHSKAGDAGTVSMDRMGSIVICSRRRLTG
jgi:hypothetical protein